MTNPPRGRGRPKGRNPDSLSRAEITRRQRLKRSHLKQTALVHGSAPQEVWLNQSLSEAVQVLADDQKIDTNELLNAAVYDYLKKTPASKRRELGIKLYAADGNLPFGLIRYEALRSYTLELNGITDEENDLEK
ncbi:MAG: hypothetical protein ACRBBW_19850 [Cellvibrionaceae bacterium]